MKVAISGASGFVGLRLRETFTDYAQIQRGDTENEIIAKLDGVDVVFNLAGAPIISRWTKRYKEILISSRVESTKKLVNAINKSEVKLFISTSAIGAYPDDGSFDESFEGYSSDFLGLLTKSWEAEANRCLKPTAIVRLGVVLGSDGGALKQTLKPFSMGLGGTIGDGKMKMSWIDVDDLVALYAHIIENELTGLFNATSPNPLSNYDFTKALGKVLRRPTILPLPEFVLKLLFGEGSTVLTSSKEVYPRAAIKSGFAFKYPTIEASMNHLLGKENFD